MNETGWDEFLFRIYISFCLLVFCKWKTRQNENFYMSFSCSICSLKWFAKWDFHLKIKFVLSKQHFHKHISQITTKPRIKWRQKKQDLLRKIRTETSVIISNLHMIVWLYIIIYSCGGTSLTTSNYSRLLLSLDEVFR